ncbi:unnamed protein product [Polarella glacialis]|uniref:Uncharacterized protein n=1 Tax=Polarella glacialis TaxID=89957 RepID=A0A813EMC8_POLGL|nr:unnamed protein product [Polarella glacialis]
MMKGHVFLKFTEQKHSTHRTKNKCKDIDENNQGISRLGLVTQIYLFQLMFRKTAAPVFQALANHFVDEENEFVARDIFQCHTAIPHIIVIQLRVFFGVL